MAAVVLYLDGQRPRDIAIIVLAVLVLLVTLVVIAPRLGEPEKQDAVSRVDHDEQDETQQPGRMPTETVPPSVPAPVAEPDAWSPETAGNTPARQPKPGRRAKRGRRRR